MPPIVFGKSLLGQQFAAQPVPTGRSCYDTDAIELRADETLPHTTQSMGVKPGILVINSDSLARCSGNCCDCAPTDPTDFILASPEITRDGESIANARRSVETL